MATIHITNQAGLAAMTNNNDYILDNDINLSGWTSISSLNNITFDGQGHVISNLTAPIIQNLYNSTFSNTILDANITGGTYAGAVAAMITSTSINNNIVNGTVGANSNTAGGLVGYASNASSFNNNTNNANVSCENFAWGIGGYLFNARYSDSVLEGNVNTGQINGEIYAGGIIAAASGTGTNVIIRGNVNYGGVSGDNATGGIAGNVQAILTDNKNYGDVAGESSSIGGIVGHVTSGSVINNENHANVTGLSRVGGIIGGGIYTTITGNINYCGTVAATISDAGGVVGWVDTYSAGKITDNKSFATSITAPVNAERILGRASDTSLAPTILSDNYASPNTLLTGDNTGTGGLIYSNQTVNIADPQYGASGQQGADIICAGGEYLDNCAGQCVRIGDSVVSFESNGGSDVLNQEVPYGETATVPTAPTRGCDVFLGWYTDTELTQPYDFSAPVTGDITLYAKWLDVPCPPEPPADTFTVRFNACCGSYVAPQTVAAGKKAVKPANPRRCGYVFCGWYLDCRKYDFSKAVERNLCLTARWSATDCQKSHCGCG